MDSTEDISYDVGASSFDEILSSDESSPPADNNTVCGGLLHDKLVVYKCNSEKQRREV